MSIKIGETTKDIKLLGRRDAFHAPAILVQSNVIVNPKDDVKFLSSKLVCLALGSERHGVVDPFVIGPIQRGTFFWVLLNPDCTSNLTHNYEVKFQADLDDEVEEDVEELKQEIKDLEREVTRLKRIEKRFDGYDEDDGGCRGCY